MGICKTYWIGVVACAAVLPAFAQWQLIDDFQQWEDEQIFTEATEIGWNAYNDNGTDEYWIIKTKQDSNNLGLYINPGYDEYSIVGVRVIKSLPDGGIHPGTTGTIFFRCLWMGLDTTWSFSTSDKPLELDPLTGTLIAPRSNSDLNARVRRRETLPFLFRDGDASIYSSLPDYPKHSEWYNFWMVVENTWDNSTVPPISTGEFSFYISGPGFGDNVSPTLIPVGTDPPKDSASFRRAPVDDDGKPQPIIWLMFGADSRVQMECPSCGYLYILDDLYFSKGSNLNNPLFYAGFPVDGSRYADTGPFLGWLNITQAPYLWSYALNGWLYMEEPAADAQGTWGYFFK